MESTISYRIGDLAIGDIVQADDTEWKVTKIFPRGNDRLKIFLKNGKESRQYVFYKQTEIDDNTFGDL